MISWLKGEKIENWQNGSRLGVLISCSGIGYEVQLLKRELELLNISTQLTLWVHQFYKEEGSHLIGFLEKSDRNLFRKLISISGIGPQIALALLEQNNAQKLVLAIKKRELSQLTSCPGIGKRTAERLVIELKDKLSESDFIQINKFEPEFSSKNDSHNSFREEVVSALINLGYQNPEIEKALNELKATSNSFKSEYESSEITYENLDFKSLFKETIYRINK